MASLCGLSGAVQRSALASAFLEQTVCWELLSKHLCVHSMAWQVAFILT